MAHNLINRKSEFQFLQDAFAQDKAQFIVIYGRRRVGKSFLTEHFVKEKNGIYFLCSKGNEFEQLELLSSKLAEAFQDDSLISRPFRRWHDLFSYLAAHAKGKKIVLEFDEFPFLIEANSAIPSIFQKYWDELISKTNAYFILCGSSIGMMESQVLSQRSPLYGRRTGQWKLTPLHFIDVVKFFKSNHRKMESIVEIYSITGGMPYYLVALDLEKSALENIFSFIIKKGQPLSIEGELLVKEELPEAPTYFSILRAIAQGQTKSTDIANHTGMAVTALSRYLTNLQRLGFIDKIVPVTEKERSKKSLYKISDNFLNFWFKFVYPYQGYLEEEEYEKIHAILQKELPAYVGLVFEQICRQALLELRKNNTIEFDKIGSWWGAYRGMETKERKTVEIDIVTLQKEKKEILLGECKWQNQPVSVNELIKLEEKCKLIEWNSGKRSEKFVFFAKNGFEENAIKYVQKKNNWKLYTLNDLEKIFNSKHTE